MYVSEPLRGSVTVVAARTKVALSSLGAALVRARPTTEGTGHACAVDSLPALTPLLALLSRRGAYKYVAELYKKKQSDVMRFLMRVRYVRPFFSLSLLSGQLLAQAHGASCSSAGWQLSRSLNDSTGR